MSLDLRRILEHKQTWRRRTAALPLAEKLRLLDALRERTVLLCCAGRQARGQSLVVREPQSPCGHHPERTSEKNTQGG